MKYLECKEKQKRQRQKQLDSKDEKQQQKKTTREGKKEKKNCTTQKMDRLEIARNAIINRSCTTDVTTTKTQGLLRTLLKNKGSLHHDTSAIERIESPIERIVKCSYSSCLFPFYFSSAETRKSEGIYEGRQCVMTT